MRILLIHDELYPNTSANARIVYRIVDELLKHSDVEVTIMGCAQTKEQSVPLYHGCQIIHAPWDRACRYIRFVNKLGRFKWLRFFLMPRSIVYRILHPRWMPRDVEMMRWIYHHRRQFDVVLACAMPFYSIDIAAQVSKYIPVVNYYMESYWKNSPSRYFTEQDISRLWDGLASRVIVPEHIKQIYKKYADKDIVDKLVVAEFPNVQKCELYIKNEPQFCTEKINLAFVGKFYPKVRDPQYLFDIIDCIQTSGICLNIAGGFNGSFSKSFIERYFTNKMPYMSFRGMLPPDKADAMLMQADILVHIGNTIPEMLPSKILDYISTGKPIINLYQHDLCPTLSILDAYPLKLNIRVDSSITDELLNNIVSFCVENRGKQIPYEEIESRYQMYTPQFVGGIFYKTLLEVSKKNK